MKMNIHLVNPLFLVIVLLSLIFHVKKWSTASTAPHKYTHSNHKHIMVVLEAVQAHEHSVPLGPWGSPESSHMSSSAHLGSAVEALGYLGSQTCPTQGNKTKAMQIVLSTVLLCHTSSKGWQISSARHQLTWQIMEELTTKARLGWLV